MRPILTWKLGALSTNSEHSPGELPFLAASIIEQELAALRNLVRGSPSTKPNTDDKTSRNTHSTMKNAKAHDQPPVFEPSNSAPSTSAPMSTPKPSKLRTRPPVLKSRLPWIKSVKLACHSETAKVEKGHKVQLF